MHGPTVVVAQSDCIVAEHLAASLHTYFKNVVVARDVEEIRHRIQQESADIVVVDLDLAEMFQVRGLAEEFTKVGIICTHRVPDEPMWRLCLEAGALDCCSCNDVQSIVRAARRHPHTSKATAA